jgi:hypothetical protein
MSNEIDEDEVLWVQNSESWASLGIKADRTLTVSPQLRLELEEVITTIGRSNGTRVIATGVQLSPDDALALADFLKTAAGNALYLEATK